MSKKNVIGAIILLVLLTIGIYLVAKTSPESRFASNVVQTRFLDEDSYVGPPVESLPLSSGEIENAAKTLENSKNTILVDVSGGTSTGLAYKSSDDNKLYIFIQAELPRPSGSSFYEGWLVGDSSRGEVVSTGEFKTDEQGYVSSFISDNPQIFSEYKKIIITLENTRDSVPEAHILEGSF